MKTRRPNYDPVEKAALIKDYMDGLDTKELAIKYNTSRNSIYKLIERLGPDGYKSLFKLSENDITKVRAGIEQFPRITDLCKEFNAQKRELWYLLEHHSAFADCWICYTCDSIKTRDKFQNRQNFVKTKFYKRCFCKACTREYKKYSYQKEIACPIRKEKRRQRTNNYSRKLRTRPAERIKISLRARVRSSLKGLVKKSARTMELVGCSIEFLKEYLEKQFTTDMSWENYGRGGWEIDHVFPCAMFKLENPEQQQICFHYSNLQPRWATTAIAIAHGEPDGYVGNVEKGPRLLL